MDKEKIINHFERTARNYNEWKEKNSYYYDHLKSFFKMNIQTEHRVIEYGCGTGDILASFDAKEKVGLDIAQAMIEKAKTRHPDISFNIHDCETLYSEHNKFDIAVLADIIDHITDILKLFASVNNSLKPGGKMLISTANPLWGPILAVAEKLGQKMPEGEHNFVSNRDLINLLRLRGFRLINSGAVMLLPKRIPAVSEWLNRLVPKLPFLNRFCVAQTIVAEKIRDYPESFHTDMTCSVIIPCCGKEADVSRFGRIPNMGKQTEIIVVCDRASPGIAGKVDRLAEKDSRVKLIYCSSEDGREHSIKQGFDHSTGDVMIVLDVDLTVMPEELPLFFRPIAEGIADLTNGTRMIYPIPNPSMRYFHRFGNFFFNAVFSWLVSQRISDALCSAKAIKRSDYANIRMGSDIRVNFDLLFGAADNGLTIVEIPVHHKAPRAGIWNMRIFKRCLVLLTACFQGFVRLKLKRWRGEKQKS